MLHYFIRIVSSKDFWCQRAVGVMVLTSTVKVSTSSQTVAAIAAVSSSDVRGGGTDRHLLLDGLTVLLWDPLGDHLAVDGLLDVAVGDWDLLALLLGGVDADLLGHLTAILLDGHLRQVIVIE